MQFSEKGKHCIVTRYWKINNYKLFLFKDSLKIPTEGKASSIRPWTVKTNIKKLLKI
jgi:hypothetical protein